MTSTPAASAAARSSIKRRGDLRDLRRLSRRERRLEIVERVPRLHRCARPATVRHERSASSCRGRRTKASAMIDATARPWRRSAHRLPALSRRRNDGGGLRADRRRRSAAASVSVMGPATAAPSSVRPGPSSTTVSANRISSGGRAVPARREQNDARPRGDAADLGDHRGIVIERQLLVQDDDVGLRAAGPGAGRPPSSPLLPTTKSPRSSRRKRASPRSSGRRSATIAMRRDGSSAMTRLRHDDGLTRSLYSASEGAESVSELSDPVSPECRVSVGLPRHDATQALRRRSVGGSSSLEDAGTASTDRARFSPCSPRSRTPAPRPRRGPSRTQTRSTGPSRRPGRRC